MKIFFAIFGAFLGAVVHEWEGMVFGFFIGLLAGALILMRGRVRDLEIQLKSVRENLIDSHVEVAKEATPVEAVSTPEAEPEKPVTSVTPAPAVTTPPDEPVAETTQSEASPTEEEKQEDTWTAPPPAAQVPPFIDNITRFVREFFTTGNVVVKVAVIILFFGVAFLLKYAAERNLFPIELRLAAVAAGGIGLLITGWKLRLKNANYALVLQGGAVGILYLTVFAAAKLYAVLPLGLAFFIMFGLVIFSCLLAVIQDSKALAVFATAGGFLAPVLTSSGTGNHVALFSYYALLNAGILGIAWFKAWRILNWVGFVFTFVIASLWGANNYVPEKFATTEPFLVLFFLFYIAIAVLFAHRQPPQLKGLVDGTLVFGTPLVGFALQTALVKDYEFGLAYSALFMAIVYTGLARVLWYKQVEGMRLLTEAFLALGVIFASLTIPMALDGRWTAAVWSVEGAGVIWMGIRQHRLLPRLFGLLLQIGAAVMFLTEVGHPHADWPVFNSGTIGSVLISIAALFTGLQYYRHGDALKVIEKNLNIPLMIWGLCWWVGAGYSEIDAHLSSRYEINAFVFFMAVSMLIMSTVARRLQWPVPEHATLILLPIITLFAFVLYIDRPYRNPLINYGYITWISTFIIQYLLMHRGETVWPRKLTTLSHAWTMWLFIFMVSWITAQAISYYIPGLKGWGSFMWGFIPAMAIFMLIYYRDRLQWPLQAYPESYLGNGLFPVSVVLALWVIITCFRAGNPAPLGYLPILNPQDLVQLFAMLSLLNWSYQQKKQRIPVLSHIHYKQQYAALAAMLFLWLNALVAHGVHFYAGVRYDLDAMFHSALFQTCVSIVWTLVAFILMGVATTLSKRKLWFAGAILLGAVVVKLFIIDLADTGTIPRIVSFLSVGGIMLVIGYFSPLPPKSQADG